MKKSLKILLIFFLVLSLGIRIRIISLVVYCFVYCCSGNKELMYKGEIKNSKIKIEKNLGNATMASYMDVYVDGQMVYSEKCFVGDTVENVIWDKDMGILKIILQEKSIYETEKDTITITIKENKDQK